MPKIIVELSDEALDAIADRVAARVAATLKGAAPAEEKAPAKKAEEKAPAKKAEKAPEKEPETLGGEEGTEENHGDVEVTKDEAMAYMAEFRKKHGVVVTMEVISKFGTKFADVPAEKYAALLEAAKAKEAELTKSDDLDF